MSGMGLIQGHTRQLLYTTIVQLDNKLNSSDHIGLYVAIDSRTVARKWVNEGQ